MKTEKKPAPSNERLAEIYRTAAQIILRKGYDATSINDIANAVGMTKAGLYHYINGKKELLFDIMMEDGIAAQRGDREMRVMDVAELLWEALSTDSTDSIKESA